MTHLTVKWRYIIQSMRADGQFLNVTAMAIGKDKSVVPRKLKRNVNQSDGLYNLRGIIRAQVSIEQCPYEFAFLNSASMSNCP